jgi:hypothetical protein
VTIPNETMAPDANVVVFTDGGRSDFYERRSGAWSAVLFSGDRMRVQSVPLVRVLNALATAPSASPHFTVTVYDS